MATVMEEGQFSSGWDGGEWESPSFGASRNVVLSDCRELVEVPSGSDYQMRKLMEECPEFCWRYVDTTATIQYHYQTLCNATAASSESMMGDVAPARQSTASIPVFFAVFTHCYSPHEFCIQPKFLRTARASLVRELEEAYRFETPLFKDDQIFVGVPCVANICDVDSSALPKETDENGQEIQPRSETWVRGRVEHFNKGPLCEVRLVDKGTNVLLPRAALRPLFRRLGKLPPLAMKCKLKGVCVNDLEVSRVTAFRALLTACRFLVRVELTTLTEPFHVNLYHPTVEGDNLGATFYRAPTNEGHEAAKQRKYEQHVRRMVNEESDFDDDDEYDEDEEEELYAPQYVAAFPRADKVFRLGNDAPLFVGHIENTRVICLHSDRQLSARRAMEEELEDVFPSLPPVHVDWIKEGAACIVKLASWPRPNRATIDRLNGGWAKVVLIDYGNVISVRVRELRLCPEEYAAAPHVYAIGLYNATCYLHPHPTETAILKEIFATTPGTVTFEMEKGKQNPPRGRLIHESIGDVNKELRNRLSALPRTRRFVHPCTDLIAPSPLAPLLAHSIRADYEHVLAVPTCYLRGPVQAVIEALPLSAEEEEQRERTRAERQRSRPVERPADPYDMDYVD